MQGLNIFFLTSSTLSLIQTRGKGNNFVGVIPGCLQCACLGSNQSRFVCVCVCVCVFNSFATSFAKPARLLCPWDFPNKNSGMVCHFLLQGIFPTQASNSRLLHCRQVLYHRATREACQAQYRLLYKCYHFISFISCKRSSSRHINPVQLIRDPWAHKESDTTEWLNWTELNW